MANDFLTYLKCAFTCLYEETRISGRPGHCMAIKHFIEFIKTFSNVWIARRMDIAQHWLSQSNKTPLDT
ncbi:hypothetical protein [Legionella nagasakiensis]|uniref:hypothetical protein n=1 Tax=Legionella nagasakiensis TaxID=535290 RepID=UPI001F5EB0BC|nr:hypothetical protein [Legionella nagasakiensis]